MSASRRKGNHLELWWARQLQAVDGRDPAYAAIETDGGRLGNTYRLQGDVVSATVASECKNREDNPRRLWDWLTQLDNRFDKLNVLVLKRNHRPALVVMDAEDFLILLKQARR